MLHQCPNQQWKDRLMEGKMDFQEAIDYGMSKLTATEEGKLVGSASAKSDSPVLPVDKLEKEVKTVNCGNCFEKHKARSCPAWGYQCSKCHKPNHLAGKRNCRGQPPAGAEHSNLNNRGGGRGRWNNQGDYDRHGNRRDDRRATVTNRVRATRKHCSCHKEGGLQESRHAIRRGKSRIPGRLRRVPVRPGY